MTASPKSGLPDRLGAGFASVARGTRSPSEGVTTGAVHQLVRRARELIADDKSTEAADVLRSALTTLDLIAQPQRDDTWRRMRAQTSSLLGQSLQLSGDASGARLAFQAAIKGYDGLPELPNEDLLAYALALHGCGDFDRAINFQRQVIQQGEAAPAVGIQLGCWLREADRLPEAVDVLSALIDQYPEDAEVSLSLADALDATDAINAGEALADAGIKLLNKGDLNRAREILDRASVRMPGNPQVVIAQALTLAGLRLIAEATQKLDYAIELGGDEQELRVQKAAMLAEVGQRSAALDELDRLGSFAEHSVGAITVRGYVHYINGDFPAAETELRRACALDPSSPYLQMLLGDTLHRSGHSDEAMTLLDRAIELDPRFAEARRVRGGVLVDLGELDKALADLREALALAPKSAASWASLGEAQRQRRQLDSAAGALNRAIELDPNNAWAVWTRGRVLTEQKKFSEAIIEFKRAIELDESFVEAFVTLGEVCARLGRHQEALAAFDRALAVPDSTDSSQRALRDGQRAYVLVQKATAQEDDEDYAAAAAALREALTLDPTNGDLRANLAEDLRLSGQPREALAVIDAAGELLQTHADALAVKGYSFAAIGETESAIEALQQAVAARPGYAWALTELGNLYNDQNRLEDAESMFRAAVASEPSSLDAQRGLGDVLRQLGRFVEAYAALESALVVAPSDRLTQRLLGYTFFAEGRFDEALTRFHRILAVSPDDVVVLSDVVRVLLGKEDYDEALKISETAVQMAPRSVPVLAAYGTVLCDIGEFEAAATILRVAVVEDPNDAEAHALLGWALENQGPEQLDEALTALRAAVHIDDDPVYRKEVATVLLNLGDGAATEEFTAVLETIDIETTTDSDELATAAWCLYGLGRLDEAVSVYRSALRRGSGPDIQFDLALALLCKDDGSDAVEEYRRAVIRVDRRPRLRRRGLLRVALVDIDDATRIRGLSTDRTATSRSLVEQALQQVESDLGTTVAEAAGDSPILEVQLKE